MQDLTEKPDLLRTQVLTAREDRLKTPDLGTLDRGSYTPKNSTP